MSYQGNNAPNSNAGATYGARNYGNQRSSGRRQNTHKSHNTSDSSAGRSAGSGAGDFSLHNGVRTVPSRASGRRQSGRRSSGRRQRAPVYNHHTGSFETASTVSSSASILPPSTVRSNGTSTSFGSATTAPPPPAPKKGLFNFTGRGMGATIAIIAGIVMGGTGMMMLVMGFSGGTAMLVMGPCLMVAGIVSIGIGAGLCICCRRKKGDEKDSEAQPPSKEVSFDDLNTSQGSSRPPPAGAMLGGGANVNVAYQMDGAEDSLDTVPTVAAQVPQPQYPLTNAYAQPQPMKSNPRTLVMSNDQSVVASSAATAFAPAPVKNVFAPKPVASVSAVPGQMYQSAPAQVHSAAPQMSALVGTAPIPFNESLSSSMESSASVIVEPVAVSSIHQHAPHVPAPAPPQPQPPPQAPAATDNKASKGQKPPRAKLQIQAPPPEPTKPAVKLPVPIRGPVVTMNPMPQPKQKGRQRSASPNTGGGMVPVSPQTSSFSENSEFSSSADESGNRINSSTDASGAESGGTRKHRIKKRVSFSDDDKKAKKAKRKLRNSKEHQEALRSSLDGEMPKSILAAKSGAEDFKYIGPPNAVKKNTEFNRGRSQSPQRSSQRNSRRTRSTSPHQRKQNPRPPQPQPDPTALHNGPRVPSQKPRAPLDTSDPAVQSRLRRNSRRRSKEREPRRQPQPQLQRQPAFENQGYVNEAMDFSPTSSSPPQLPSPEHSAPPIASSSPNTSLLHNNNSLKVAAGNGVSNWAPIHSSTPPGTPKPAVLQLANYSHSSTETEI